MKRSHNHPAMGIFAALVTLVLFPLVASANSSWRWASIYRPLDVFPFLLLSTLLIEIPLLHFIPRLRCLQRTAGAVCLANLCSFGVPWLLRLFVYLENRPVYPLFSQFLEAAPTFNTDFFNYLLTLLVELPLLWLLLGRGQPAKRQKALLWTAFGVNTGSTLLCAIVEHSLCYGSW